MKGLTFACLFFLLIFSVNALRVRIGGRQDTEARVRARRPGGGNNPWLDPVMAGLKYYRLRSGYKY